MASKIMKVTIDCRRKQPVCLQVISNTHACLRDEVSDLSDPRDLLKQTADTGSRSEEHSPRGGVRTSTWKTCMPSIWKLLHLLRRSHHDINIILFARLSMYSNSTWHLSMTIAKTLCTAVHDIFQMKIPVRIC